MERKFKSGVHSSVSLASSMRAIEIKLGLVKCILFRQESALIRWFRTHDGINIAYVRLFTDGLPSVNWISGFVFIIACQISRYMRRKGRPNLSLSVIAHRISTSKEPINRFRCDNRHSCHATEESGTAGLLRTRHFPVFPFANRKSDSRRLRLNSGHCITCVSAGHSITTFSPSRFYEDVFHHADVSSKLNNGKFRINNG